MKKRILPTIFCAALLLLSSSCASLLEGDLFTKTITFTKSDIQNRLSGKFPMERDISAKDQKIATFVVDEPNIVLQDGSDRIGLKLNGTCKLPQLGIAQSLFPQLGEGMKGGVYFTGRIQFNREEGRFYFQDPILHELTIPGLPEQATQAIADTLSVAIGTYLDSTPIYDLNKKSNLKNTIGKQALKSLKIQNGKVVAVLGLTF